MAGILKSCCSHWNNCQITFLIIGPRQFSELLSAALHDSARERQWKIFTHQGESVTQVSQYKVDLGIDFIIFTFDGRVSDSLVQVESDIKHVDEFYVLSGASCLVNCSGVLSSMGQTFHKLSEIQNKYKIQFLSANVLEKKACLRLANRILNLTEGILGITSGVPVPIL